MTTEGKESKDNKAVYLYCLANSDKIQSVSGFGLDQATPLSVTPYKNIVAVYSIVDLADFTEDEAEKNLQDIHWIGPRALAHEKVVEQISDTSPVLPARFGTIFSTFAKMEELLAIKHDAIAQFLEQIAGRQEWSIKGYLDTRQAAKKQADSEVAVQAEELDKLAPGTRYFQERKIANAAKETVSDWIRDQVAAIAGDLDSQVVQRVDRATLSREATGKDADMILNWAALVDMKGVSQLEEIIQKINRRHADEGLVLEFSGPWPPYSFCPSFSLDNDT